MTAAPAAHQLTAQEISVINLITQGLTNQKIAEKLFVSPRTIHAHIRNIYAKTGVRSRVALAAVWAEIQRGVTMTDDQAAAKIAPVRISVDLTPALYRMLTGWVMATAVELEISRLSIADTIRGMIMVTAENPEMSQAVQDAIARGRS